MGEHSSISVGLPADGGAQQGTTTFSSTTLAEPYDRNSSIIDPNNDLDVETDDIKSISDFLAKPVAVATGTWSAQTWGASLFSSDIYPMILSQPMWLNKIQGFLNIRGVVKFRLMINATPFQQGLLRLSYFPCANQMMSSYNSHMFNRMTISQLPGTYLNANDNFVEVSVPYLSPTTFLERDLYSIGKYVDWGRVDITVMEILRTGTGPSGVNWTLWMSIEDLELSAMVEPQMAFEPQMAGVRKRPKRQLASIDEEVNSGKGPIAKIMSSGVKLANNLASIPVLSPVAKPASWVLAALGAAAEALGWSKPTLSEGPCPMARNLHWYMNNSDGNDSCQPLSIRTDNRVSAITDASPGDLDEMSLNFLKSRWSYLYDFIWGPGAVSGDLLTSLEVRPGNFKQTQTFNGKRVSTVPPSAVFQEFYSNWRGSYQVRLRLIKTGFHTGTVAVTWTPGKYPGTPTYAQTSYMYRQVIDLQTGSDFVFDLPYLIPQDFLHNYENSGILTVHCVNPLLAPATCSSSIDVFLEVRGGDDLIFVNPRNTYDPIPFVPQMNDFEAQGVDTDVSGEATAVSLSSRAHTFNSVHHAMIANGEIQLSVLDILKTQSIVRYAPGFSPSANSGAPVAFAPGQIYGQRWNGSNVLNAQIGGDLVSFIGSWFAFHRGAERFRVCNLDTAASNVNYRAMYLSDVDVAINNVDVVTQAVGNVTNWSALLSATNGGSAPQCGRYVVVPRDNGGIAVQAPFYSRFRYLLNTWTTSLSAKTNYFSNQNMVAFSMPQATGVTLSRSVGDDFQFSYFVGVPLYASAIENAGPFVGVS